jgi:LmbE family N-acetylglucosaminyl deacetylase
MADEGYHPHKIKYLYIHGHDAPSLRVDITAELATKVEAILCHSSQFRDPEGSRQRWLESWGSGRRMGVSGILRHSR